MQQNAAKDIDEYIAGFPPDIQTVLQKIRRVISEAAPGALETIKYRMPTFTMNGNLVHFAAYKGHIGFYPTPSAIEHFKNELAAYRSSKGAVQFPVDKPVPFELISKIVRFRVQENLAHATGKRKKKGLTKLTGFSGFLPYWQEKTHNADQLVR